MTAEVISQAVDIENDIFTFCKDNGFKSLDISKSMIAMVLNYWILVKNNEFYTAKIILTLFRYCAARKSLVKGNENLYRKYFISMQCTRLHFHATS